MNIHIFNSTFLNPFPFPETFGLGLRWLGCLRGRWRRCVFFFGEKGSEIFCNGYIALEQWKKSAGFQSRVLLLNSCIHIIKKHVLEPLILKRFFGKLQICSLVPGCTRVISQSWYEGFRRWHSIFFHIPQKIGNINNGKVFHILSFEFGQGIL